MHALRAAGVPHVEAVARGVLDGLWDLTARHAMPGDIGKFSDARIARGAGWDGDPGWLIETLVGIGWLDLHSEHRLLVHDWPEHADDGVHRAMARARLYFADGTPPKWRRLNKDERPAARAFYEGTLLDQLEFPEDDECDPRREVGARRAHGGGEPRPVPSSQARESEVVIVPPAGAARHGPRRAEPRNDHDGASERRIARPGSVAGSDRRESGVALPEHPQARVGPGIARHDGVAVADRFESEAATVFEIQTRLRDRSTDARNLWAIARAMPRGEIEAALHDSWARHRDGIVRNPVAYFCARMKNRARELGIPLPPTPSAPQRAAEA